MSQYVINTQALVKLLNGKKSSMRQLTRFSRKPKKENILSSFQQLYCQIPQYSDIHQRSDYLE
ncbi:hypothetical protein U27_06035 [Candidatus Vecturithrix granuli]|uniref:Uncharacterized protein n=1 Tax=Vecturithrix granuli TaxID=1499967 RepID=A0A081C3A4_VECG1|nr:hypothetical protein U27_06035 [Candidatus Vecturithrix granuli]